MVHDFKTIIVDKITQIVLLWCVMKIREYLLFAALLLTMIVRHVHADEIIEPQPLYAKNCTIHVTIQDKTFRDRVITAYNEEITHLGYNIVPFDSNKGTVADFTLSLAYKKHGIFTAGLSAVELGMLDVRSIDTGIEPKVIVDQEASAISLLGGIRNSVAMGMIPYIPRCIRIP